MWVFEAVENGRYFSVRTQRHFADENLVRLMELLSEITGLKAEAKARADARAEPFYQRNLAIREKVLGPEHPGVAHSLNDLAELYRGQGCYAEAEPLYRRSLAIREKVFGPEDSDVATSLENYAALLRETGREDKAEEMEARAKAIRAKLAETNPPS